MEPLAAGDPARVNDFILRGRLGTGGMGQVFLGRSLGGRTVAVKLVHPHLARQAEFRSRFRREVAAARAVSGAFTAPVVAAGTEDDPPWIATVYVPGPSLAEAVAATGGLPQDSVWPLAAGLAEALQAIHAEGLLHRDLKPSNVLLTVDGPRVIDFGIARAMDSTVLTEPGKTIGTPGFMSPEQAEGGQVEQPSDIFALGAVLAFAATGVRPFGEGEPLAVLLRVVTGAPQLDGLTDPLRALVAACLAKKPADRPTTAQLLEQIATRWDPPDDFPPTPPWPQAVTALIQTHGTPATALYTAQATTPPFQHSAPTPTAPARQAPTHPHQGPSETDRPAGPAGGSEPKPRALRRRHWRALTLRRSGEFAEAARVLADLIPDRAQAWGPDHSGTLEVRRHHALTVGEAGNHVEAARLLADLVPDMARVLGPDDRYTLEVRQHHARELGEAGEHMEAARLLADLVPDFVRLRGPDHRVTLGARRQHAAILGEAGEHMEAARLLADLTPDFVLVWGPDHPESLAVRLNRAWELGEAGEHADAARLFAEGAADQARVLGPDHPDTLKARYFQAWHTGDTGDDAAAARLFAEVAVDYARVLGPDHSDTLRARRLHAHVLGRAGERGEAAGLLAGLIEDYARVLGLDHPHALTARHNHASVLGQIGEYAEAARLFAELATDSARVLGRDHSHTLMARSSADHWSAQERLG
ncbi:serine/threonine-protein kinase [Streptomyces smyrnaeus]|uniref:serine/threonine-protein kinase n=1 Tax=Streptomyces smyrnaeus TaxID=1387713 RepID=UPI0033F18E74